MFSVLTHVNYINEAEGISRTICGPLADIDFTLPVAEVETLHESRLFAQ